MKKMTNVIKLTSSLIVLLIFLNGKNLSISPEKLINKSDNSNVLVLILLNYDELLCQPCTNSFFKLCEFLQNLHLKDPIWGILIREQSFQEGPQKEIKQVIRKQLNGFLKANYINFPFIIDDTNILGHNMENNVALIIFNKNLNSMKKWSAPLDENAINEIKLYIKQGH